MAVVAAGQGGDGDVAAHVRSNGQPEDRDQLLDASWDRKEPGFFDEASLPHLRLGCREVPFYPKAVRDYAERVHPKPANPSSCVGPVLKLAVCVPFIHIFLALVVILISASAHSCDMDRADISRRLLWLIWIPIGFVMMAIEHYIFAYTSVSYSQWVNNDMTCGPFDTLKWIVEMIAECLGCGCTGPRWSAFKAKYRFTIWYLYNSSTSISRLVSFFSMNAFIGLAFHGMFLESCEVDVESVWTRTMHQSLFWSQLEDTVSLRSVFVFMLLAEIANLLVGAATAFPRWNQWTDRGTMPAEKVGPDGKTTWHQDYEFDVIEFISFRDNDERRPKGNRFNYVSLSSIEVTSKGAVQNVGAACGMACIVKQIEASMSAEPEMIRDSIARADPQNIDEVQKIVHRIRILAQDAQTVVITTLSHVFLYATCLQGISLQLQITYYNSRCWNLERCKVEPMETGVLFGFLNIFFSCAKIYRAWLYHMDSNRTFEAYMDWYKERELYNLDGWEQKHVNQSHEKVETIRKRIWYVSLFVWPADALCIFMFVWALSKWYMTSQVCPSRMWNVDFVHPYEGCVT